MLSLELILLSFKKKSNERTIKSNNAKLNRIQLFPPLSTFIIYQPTPIRVGNWFDILLNNAFRAIKITSLMEDSLHVHVTSDPIVFPELSGELKSH